MTYCRPQVNQFRSFGCGFDSSDRFTHNPCLLSTEVWWEAGLVVLEVVRRGAQGETDPEGIAPGCPNMTLRNSGTEQRPRDARSSCFVAGTLVHTPEGCRPIETITIGQRVTTLLPQDQTSGQWRTDTVAETFQREYTGTMVAIQIAGETLRATARHPFWVVRGEDLETRPITQELGDDNQPGAMPGRWVEARNLREGDTLLTRDGGEVEIEAVSLSEETTTVYNLHVGDCRTYVVGRYGVVVHNQSAPPLTGDCQSVSSFSNDHSPPVMFAVSPVGHGLPEYAGARTQRVLVVGSHKSRLISGQTNPGKWLQQSGFSAQSWYHVEGHAVSIMLQCCITRATLYINQKPCSDRPPYCQSTIPRALPAGSVLEVVFESDDHTSTGTRRFIGGIGWEEP